MFKRTSIVNDTKINSIGLSGVFEVGDSVQITPRSKALAIQRQKQLFFGNEGDFDQFSIFSKSIPKPDFPINISVNQYNHSPLIKVNHIRVLAVSFASVYQIGSTHCINSEARIKHIRQLQGPPNTS